MEMYTSIQRHYRGYNYQKDYSSISDFTKDMNREEDAGRDICWAKLFNEETGDEVSAYKREDKFITT